MKKFQSLVSFSAASVVAAAAGADVSLHPATNYITAQRPSGVAAGDWDKDGDIDFAVTVDTPDRLLVFTNDGAGAFTQTASVQLGSGVGAGEMVAADVDGDLDLDLAISLQNANGVRIMKNTGGVFAAAGTTTVGANPRTVIAAHFNGDGAIDLAVANRDGNSVSVLTNSGTGTFTAATTPAGEDVRSVAAGDWDKDGDQDIVASSHDDRTVRILTNNGGVFSATGQLNVNPTTRPSGLVSGDWDNDGDTDAAVTITDDDIPLNLVQILVNNGGLTIGQSFTTNGPNPGPLAAGDFNDDGFLDIVAANEDGTTISVLENNKAGGFIAGVTFGVGTHPTALAVADLDGSNTPDVVVPNRDSDNTSVLLNALISDNCYADCDASGTLNIDDFICFQTLYAIGDPTADCDASGTLNIDDFICFQTLYAIGC